MVLQLLVFCIDGLSPAAHNMSEIEEVALAKCLSHDIFCFCKFDSACVRATGVVMAGTALRMFKKPAGIRIIT